MGSNCSINPNTAFYFVNRIKPGLTFAPLVPPQNDWKSTHRWISARWSPWLLALATNLSETHSKSKAPWKWMVGIFDPFPFWENPMFRGELFLFLGRATKWWCYFLASQAGGEKVWFNPGIPKMIFLSKTKHRNNTPGVIGIPSTPMVFVYFGFLSYCLFIATDSLREADIEASTITMEMIIWASEARKPEKTSPFTSKKSFDPPPLPSHKLSSGSVFLTHLWCFRFSGHHSIFFSVDVK